MAIVDENALMPSEFEVRPTRCDAAARQEEPVGDADTANMLAELRARRMDTRVIDLIERLSARVAELTRGRDTARRERDCLESDQGDWTGKKCPACNGEGCQKCGSTGDQWLFWKERAEAAEALVEKARIALQEYGRHKFRCDYGPVGCTCGLNAALAALEE